MDTAIQQTHNSQKILKYTYGLVPIVAGLDKFTNLLTRWEDYISAPIANILPFSAGTFMVIVGIIEIAAGVLVLLRPRIGAYVVMAWLIAIALTLVVGGKYFDVAVRDLVMAIGAFVLAKLSGVFNDQKKQSMKKHIVKVLKTDFLNPGVKRFVVKKPAGYVFIPGQATTISINEPKLTNQSRPFTFTSINQSDHLEFIIKIYTERNGVTKKLLEVKAGDELILHEVFGTIRYQGPGLFIAGGMGITPFIAIFRQLELQAQLAGNSLLFANRTEGDIILKKELEQLLGENFVNVLELTTDPGMKNGFIGSKLLKQYATTDTAYYYICGPAKFTIIIIKHLLTLGIEKSQIITEKQQPSLAFSSTMLNQPIQLN